MTSLPMDRRIGTVRCFNRFYTRQIGLLQEKLWNSPLSLTEGRVLYELAHREKPVARDVGKELLLDPGYLSRVLRSLEKRGLVTRAASKEDGRESLLSLTRRGRDLFKHVNARSQQQTGAMLRNLTAGEQQRLVEAMGAVEALLGAPKISKEPYLLRTHQPGDMGWVVHRQGLLYWQEYGYDEDFEALCAKIVAEFILNFEPKRERCWIAEREGEIVGSVFLVRHSPDVAQLRLLLVEPAARGMGIGKRLVEECIRFARQVGYRKITLWTQSELHAARHIYRKTGFSLVRKKAHHSFGKDLVAETWERKL
jgi:DNA-binding MarR family transcriptional regulator/N-acetylglutamate synthase-like GNAT family acetyltransferase